MTLPELTIPDAVHQVPDWAVWAAATVATALVLYVGLRRARPAVLASPQAVGAGGASGVRQTVAAAGPLAALGACGMVLSLNGLYGFATETMDLAPYWAVPIMAIFDLAEIVCFVSLYRSAAVESSWTRPMRQTRRMAWALVAASSTMNAVHAPGNTWAMVVFAAVPVISAKLIEFELHKRMSANEVDADPEDASPGLVRLIQIAYTRVWAVAFARLGWDAKAKDGLIHHEARIRRAANSLHELRRALDARDHTAAGRRKAAASRRVDDLQDKAERAIDASGIAGDTPAQLTLARVFATRGRVIDLARMDVRDPMAIVRLLEELAIVPSVEAIAAGAAAAEAQKQQKEAEEARDQARTELAAAQRKAAEVEASAAEQRAAAEALMTEAQEAATRAGKEAEDAAERAAAATRLADEADERHQQLAANVERLDKEASGLRTVATTDEEAHRRLSRQLDDLRNAISQAETEAGERRREAEGARTEAQQAMNRQRAAREEVQRATEQVEALQAKAKTIQGQTHQLADEHDRQAAAVARMTSEAQEAEATARRAKEQAMRMLAEAQEAEDIRRAATVALQTARDHLLDALTDPKPYESPRWTSAAKMRGWDLYLHKVSNEGAEPTDAELAGDERDPSTARKWLGDFRAELARRTAAALPAQGTAHERTADRTPLTV
ncbi:hypothetical protein OHS71_41150 (plasmid) [Streptomyces sp. NBC_00377]|uniref:hypothetical protein n=1 Tax=unclassified Streptomyces TaxID=2593676 RepID=UPI002E1ADC5B|nr:MULTISPECIES: hypothetical protein [unclassified Streptomyces]